MNLELNMIDNTKQKHEKTHSAVEPATDRFQGVLRIKLQNAIRDEQFDLHCR